MTNSDEVLISELWAEHKNAPFPKGFRAKDVSGIDFVMLDADVAGCVGTFLGRGTLNLYQTAILGLSYRNLTYVIPIINDEGKEYFWRLERLAELVLKAVALKNEKEHKGRG
jgi:hypothetical protein